MKNSHLFKGAGICAIVLLSGCGDESSNTINPSNASQLGNSSVTDSNREVVDLAVLNAIGSVGMQFNNLGFVAETTQDDYCTIQVSDLQGNEDIGAMSILSSCVYPGDLFEEPNDLHESYQLIMSWNHLDLPQSQLEFSGTIEIAEVDYDGNTHDFLDIRINEFSRLFDDSAALDSFVIEVEFNISEPKIGTGSYTYTTTQPLSMGAWSYYDGQVEVQSLSTSYRFNILTFDELEYF